MKCNSSKFLLISLLTFLVGVGFAQVWAFFSRLNNTEPVLQIVQNSQHRVNYQSIRNEPCEGKNKNPKFQKVKFSNFLTVPGGVLNYIVCGSLPEPPLSCTKGPSGPIHGKDYLMVQVTADEDGFIRSANSEFKNELAKRFEKIAKSLRIQPAVLDGKRYKCSGVLIFYRDEDYSDR